MTRFTMECAVVFSERVAALSVSPKHTQGRIVNVFKHKTILNIMGLRNMW